MDYLEGVQDLIETTTDPLAKDAPSVSVIVVSYARNEQLIDCLNSLRHQTLKDFEVILVDNGGNQRVQEQIRDHVVRYVRLKQNYGLSAGRNVGIVLARAPLVVFLDDDLIAAPGLVEAHVRAHQELDIAALRGRCLPKTRTICNYLQFHYDLGPDVRPTVMNLAGNSSFSRDLLVRAGGFHPEFFGHEELELTYRLVTEHGIHRNRIIYYPQAVGYHDYCHSIGEYAKKRSRHCLLYTSPSPRDRS